MRFDFINRVRQNHALEHATIAMLMAKMKPKTSILGRATGDGFCLYTNAPSDAVTQAAEEGLARLKTGERDLAVSPRCGTNLAVTALLATLASMAAIRGSDRGNRVPNALLLTMGAVMISRPLGRLAQRLLTTSTDLSALEIADVTSKGKGRWTRHKIRTLRT
jgi:hypothetical protein